MKTQRSPVADNIKRATYEMVKWFDELIAKINGGAK